MLRVFGRYVSAGTLLLGVTEALIACVIIYAGAIIFSGDVISLPIELELQVALIAIALVVLMHSTGLYDQAALTDIRRSLIKFGFIIGPIFILAVLTTGILARDALVPIYPYRWQWTLGLTTLWFGCVSASRLTFDQLRQKGAFTRRIAFMGESRALGQLRELANSSDTVRIVAQQALSHMADTNDEQTLQFLNRAKVAHPHEIIIDAASMTQLRVVDLVRCRHAGYSVTGVIDFLERETKCVDLASTCPQGLVFSKGLKRGLMFDIAKRSMDITGAILGLILFAPVMLLAALALRLEGSGPIFYRQERVGLHGKSFKILKFRSMRVDAEKNGIPRWTAEHDPRVTPVGRVIRKLRIDEFPQFLNVLRGDMSIVGPRPERPYFVAELGARLPFYDERHLVRPGITGWAQINFRYGASYEDAERKHSYDLYYLKHRGIFMDLVILLKTVRIVLFAEGSR